jgi:ubiquitin-like protein Pup
MTSQTRKYKTRSPAHKPTRVETPEPVKAQSRQRLKEDLDDILDDIDAVLEENAAEFVDSYIQKGGQ